MMSQPYAVATEAKVAMMDFAHTERCHHMLAVTCAGALGGEHHEDPAYSAARAWVDLIYGTLLGAPPYYVSPEVCEVLATAAPGVPSYELRREDIPTRSGWLYFARPLTLDHQDDPNGILGNLIALSWTAMRVTGDPVHDRTGAARGVGAPLSSADTVSIHVYVQAKDRPAGIPLATTTWRFGEALSSLYERGRATVDADGHPQYSQVMFQQLRYFAAAMIFMGQELFPTRREPLPRATRKRLQRAGFDPGAETSEPRVVYLRRVGKRPDLGAETEAREIERDHRWWTRGHWRNQWYETEQRHKPIWIVPHLNGPDGLPIKPYTGELYAVVR